MDFFKRLEISYFELDDIKSLQYIYFLKLLVQIVSVCIALQLNAEM